ncbi:peroxiredoxin [Solidesulfovibrio sp.]|uniref:peroxiredoxin n=1 Tax=Solidesulfovibrio sp. TaxID=2910990 RepID=UPI002B1F41C0|nr:peroxiredoxin [Solidesulfovibrio sp.]MEA4856210.1 peroxiredoxin [Solidesulfovibrio sp.]
MSDETWPKPGDPAPDFSLPDAAGAVHSLANFAGRYLVLYFYPKDATSGCTTEALEFSGLLPRFAALNAAVVGVSRDKPASHARFIDKNDLKILLLSDPDLVAHNAYGVWRMKKMCGKECLGTVRSTFLIDPKGMVEKAWPKVAKAAGHAEAVLAALAQLAGG